MYEYEDGVKKKNVGYVRVEIRNGECKFTINMRLQGLLDGIFPTYLIHRPSKDMDLLYLGDSIVKNQVMDSRLNAKEHNILNSGYDFSGVGGVLLFLNSKVFYATEWDDKPVILGEVLEALNPKKRSNAYTSGKQDKSTSKVADEGKAIDTSKVVDIRKVPDTDIEVDASKATDADKVADVSKAADADKVADESKAADADKVADESKAADADKVADESKATDTNKVADLGKETDTSKVADVRPTYKLPGGWRASEALRLGDEKEPVNPWDLVDKYKKYESKNVQNLNVVKNDNIPDTPSNDTWADKIFIKYPRIYPFEDSDVARCVKIEPKDIGVLPSDTWVLSNNSFLLHGYYCYHHLIFAEVIDKYGSHYILGIPGIYHDRERFMARMFGFECFKPIRKREVRQGDFGYWYIEVKLD